VFFTLGTARQKACVPSMPHVGALNIFYKLTAPSVFDHMTNFVFYITIYEQKEKKAESKKVVPVHAIRVFCEREVAIPLLLICARWKGVVTYKTRPFYTGK